MVSIDQVSSNVGNVQGVGCGISRFAVSIDQVSSNVGNCLHRSGDRWGGVSIDQVSSNVGNHTSTESPTFNPVSIDQVSSNVGNVQVFLIIARHTRVHRSGQFHRRQPAPCRPCFRGEIARPRRCERALENPLIRPDRHVLLQFSPPFTNGIRGGRASSLDPLHHPRARLW